MILQKKIKSPIGDLFLVASEKGLQGIFWENQNYPASKNTSLSQSVFLEETEAQLKKYFSGDLKEFKVSLDLIGTEFQKKVWKQLLKIPYGKTKSYKDIATAIGDAKACRAVGTANGKNPICIIVPCHRVVAANGTLGGYSGGLHIKEKLLEIEHIHPLERSK